MGLVTYCMLCCVEQSYQSAVSQINDIRRKKALLSAHSKLSKENVKRVEEFTKQIQHKHELLTELRKYDCIIDGRPFYAVACFVVACR